jgi:Domain of unknown function (DUF3597)
MSILRAIGPDAGGKDECFREHRIGHFWLQTRRKRNCCRQPLGAFSILGLGGRYFPASAPSAATAAGAKAPSADTSTVLAPAKPISKADVETILAKLHDEQREDFDWRTSIVDLMKLLKLDSGLAARKQLAQELGYTGALDGSAEMNVWLHKQVMTKLAESGGKVPDSLKA